MVYIRLKIALKKKTDNWIFPVFLSRLTQVGCRVENSFQFSFPTLPGVCKNSDFGFLNMMDEDRKTNCTGLVLGDKSVKL